MNRKQHRISTNARHAPRKPQGRQEGSVVSRTPSFKPTAQNRQQHTLVRPRATRQRQGLRWSLPSAATNKRVWTSGQKDNMAPASGWPGTAALTGGRRQCCCALRGRGEHGGECREVHGAGVKVSAGHQERVFPCFGSTKGAVRGVSEMRDPCGVHRVRACPNVTRLSKTKRDLPPQKRPRKRAGWFAF